jgi:hypothetical protein
MRLKLWLAALAGAMVLASAAPAMASTPAMPDGDRDGDGRTDFGILRHAGADAAQHFDWYWALSSGGFAPTMSFGQVPSGGSDIPVPADYDGDGRVEPATWRYGDGCYYISTDTGPCRRWGEYGDEPRVAADYDGDGKADLAVVRRGHPNVWYVHGSAGRDMVVPWGERDDKLAPGDYDGDGRADIAVRRTNADNTTTYWINGSSGGFQLVHWGDRGDQLVTGDYDGDGASDVAVARNVDGLLTWMVRGSTGVIGVVAFGNHNDRPVPGDHDGDGRTDLTVWRYSASPARFYVLRSGDGLTQTIAFGENGDFPMLAIQAP